MSWFLDWNNFHLFIQIFFGIFWVAPFTLLKYFFFTLRYNVVFFLLLFQHRKHWGKNRFCITTEILVSKWVPTTDSGNLSYFLKNILLIIKLIKNYQNIYNALFHMLANKRVDEILVKNKNSIWKKVHFCMDRV